MNWSNFVVWSVDGELVVFFMDDVWVLVFDLMGVEVVFGDFVLRDGYFMFIVVCELRFVVDVFFFEFIVCNWCMG